MFHVEHSCGKISRHCGNTPPVNVQKIAPSGPLKEILHGCTKWLEVAIYNCLRTWYVDSTRRRSAHRRRPTSRREHCKSFDRGGPAGLSYPPSTSPALAIEHSSLGISFGTARPSPPSAAVPRPASAGVGQLGRLCSALPHGRRPRLGPSSLAIIDGWRQSSTVRAPSPNCVARPLVQLPVRRSALPSPGSGPSRVGRPARRPASRLVRHRAVRMPR